MIGFVPGFPYMGTLPAILETKRKNIPRLEVPKGSVAIAGLQTGIYPATIPGGWNILGRTPINLFDKTKEPCSFLCAGDLVQFQSITKEEFENYKEEENIDSDEDDDDGLDDFLSGLGITLPK